MYQKYYRHEIVLSLYSRCWRTVTFGKKVYGAILVNVPDYPEYRSQVADGILWTSQLR